MTDSVDYGKEMRRERATIGALKRHHPERDTSAHETRLRAAKAAAAIAAIVESAPPLTPEQRDRLVAILRGAK